MGNQDVKTFSDPEAKKRFTKLLLSDIRALETMLNEGLIETGITRIGAEQELCLVDDRFDPACNNMETLDAINDPHFVPEIAQFNIEANLDPQDFDADCFTRMEDQLRTLLKKAHKVTQGTNTKIVMTGILPTLKKSHLDFDKMTPNPRYKALDEEIKKLRGSNFELNISGIDELITNHHNILFEACNTSFQIHMQISPEEFTEKYNWSQMIAAPILAISANSPLLLGKRLWDETRISLFQQSVDTRSSTNIKRHQEARVTFGNEWLRGTVIDLYKDNISRFNPLFASDDFEDALEVLKKGEIPELEALKMHNSTVYKWNRACYGVGGGKPHLRIENRYIPSGPTIKDEIANAALWLGTMYGMPKEYANLPDLVKFEACRSNFYKAAANGLESQLKWFGKTVSAEKLLKKIIIPIAKDGLEKAGINPKTIKYLLGIIEKRVSKKTTGANWIRENFSSLLEDSTASEASRNITEAIYNNQMTSKPIHLWKDLDMEHARSKKKFNQVNDIMETNLFIAKEDDIVEFAINLMDWKNIRNIPVENHKNEVVGVITPRELLKYYTSDKAQETVGEIMEKNFVEISAAASTRELVDLLAKTRASCILVTDGKFLTGLVEEGDIVQVAHLTKIFEA